MSRSRSAVVAAGLLVLLAGAASAAQYPGWGDTGWAYQSKRDCCAAAIAIAAQYSMNACVTTGGVPRPTTGTQRGSCRWDWMTDSGGAMLYRCYGEAAVWCR